MPIRSVLVFVLLMTAPFAESQEVGALTLLKDTPLHLIRGFSALDGVEGMRLRQGDLLETGPSLSAQAQLELNGGSVLELGPESRLLIFRQAGTATHLILLAGWLKGETTQGTYRYITAAGSVATGGGNVLVHASVQGTDVFVERGQATVSFAGLPPVASTRDRSFFSRRGGKTATAGRPSAEFIATMPVSFRDLLPSRLSVFAARKPPVPRDDHEVSYQEIEPLFKLPYALRAGFVERFRPRLHDREFRQEIAAHIAELPEWRPILYPESSNAAARTGSNPNP